MIECNGIRSALLTLALASVTLATGCAVHAGVGYRVYDPYYSDYHVWNQPEIGYYNQWTVETHRPNMEYRKLKPADQHEYWKWRHDHTDRH
jgi:hypothetical protein